MRLVKGKQKKVETEAHLPDYRQHYNCKTKSESDGSNSLTIARRLKQWHKGKQDNFFWKSAANALGKGQEKESRN